MLGRSSSRRGVSSPLRGFTLLELLLVVVLAGVVLGMVAFSAAPNVSRQLHDDAQQLAQVLRLAQEEAQVRGRPLQWQATPQGWRLSVRSSTEAGGWALLRDTPFAPHTWRSPLQQLAWLPAGGQANALPNTAQNEGTTLTLTLGREIIAPPFALLLQRDGWRVVLRSDGVNAPEVSPPEQVSP